MSRFRVVPVVIAISLSGCASMDSAKPVAVEPPPAITRLEQTANQVERMLAEMNALERSRQQQPGRWRSAADVLPPDHPLMKKITAVWSGDVRVVVRRLADQFGMDMIVKGKSPTPIMVSVSAVDTPFVSIMESIGAQTGNSVDISCDVAANTLQIEYK